MSACANVECHPDRGCDLGENELQNCPNWRAAAKTRVSSDLQNPQQREVEGAVLPWSGNAFGTEALSFVASRSNPITIAVVGPYNSGKTTLLAAWYLLVTRGIFPSGSKFSGSYTLGGWENISHRLQWSEHAGPTFPAHTPVGGRNAGMLHLAFRREADGVLRDYILIDAPGEWYRRWSIAEDQPNAEGARWIAANADLFLVLADSDSLTGEERGETRQTLQHILDRLGSVLEGRPLALVWTKADKHPKPEIQKAVRDAALLASNSLREFEVSVFPKADEELVSRRFLDVLGWAFNQPRRRVQPTPIAIQRSEALGIYGRSFGCE
ncbi:MAG TPA: hypothetical protein VFK06_11665 [Candidatus Angelobacter sp.]|nr:hypothetical protein [Candidatus Angelobacter sp.]